MKGLGHIFSGFVHFSQKAGRSKVRLLAVADSSWLGLYVLILARVQAVVVSLQVSCSGSGPLLARPGNPEQPTGLASTKSRPGLLARMSAGSSLKRFLVEPQGRD